MAFDLVWIDDVEEESMETNYIFGNTTATTQGRSTPATINPQQYYGMQFAIVGVDECNKYECKKEEADIPRNRLEGLKIKEELCLATKPLWKN